MIYLSSNTRSGVEYERTPDAEQRLKNINRFLAAGYSLAQLGQTEASYAALQQGTVIVQKPHELSPAEQAAYDQAAAKIEQAKFEAARTGNYAAAAQVELEAQKEFAEFQQSQQVYTITPAEAEYRRAVVAGEFRIQPDSEIAQALEARVPEPVVGSLTPVLPDPEPILKEIIKSQEHITIVPVSDNLVKIPELKIDLVPLEIINRAMESDEKSNVLKSITLLALGLGFASLILKK